ncbi:unnamed protein product [Orchesella dallaii]|uniref:Uncharacterized protein n=1 Tax=Orchesella dallaii TaxID=48710 RepID=A0ABP1Q1K6_9HEXA
MGGNSSRNRNCEVDDFDSSGIDKVEVETTVEASANEYACSEHDGFLRAVKRLNHALPILLRYHQYWSLRSILCIRQLNKAIKNTIDDCFAVGQCDTHFHRRVFKFTTPEEIKHFTRKANEFKGNPFILKHLCLDSEYGEDWWTEAKILLTQYGHFLRRLTLMDFLDELILPTLRFSQNIEFLTIHNFDYGWDRDEDADTDNEPVYSSKFPRLPNLKHLWLNILNAPLAPVLNSWTHALLFTYGRQLRTLHCTQKDFCQVIRWGSVSSNLLNLEELQVNYINQNQGDLVFEILADVKWTKLKRLCLKEICEAEITFSNYTSKALDTFSNSLEELSWPKINDESFDYWTFWFQSFFFSSNENIKVCSSLKLLRARESNLESPMWLYLSARFVNLECLRFEMDMREMRYSPPLPDRTVVEGFFGIFSKLRCVMWPKDSLRIRWKPECHEYIVYMRNGNSYEVIDYKENGMLVSQF